MAKSKPAPQARAALPRRLSHEVIDDLDRTPVEMPPGFRKPTPLQDIIARMVREEIQREQNEEFETPEEADDFEEEDAELLDMSAYTFDVLDERRALSAELEPPPSLEQGQEGPQTASEAPQETIGDRPDPDAEEPVKQS